MVTQLNPMLPVYSTRHHIEGFAFLVIDYSQEHDLLFTVALDNGEIWTLNSKELRFCKNISMERELPKTVQKGDKIEMIADGYMFKKGEIYTVGDVSDNGKFFYYAGTLAISVNDKRYKVINSTLT